MIDSTPYFRIQRLPTKGVLLRAGKELVIGSRFTQDELEAGQITYKSLFTSESGFATDTIGFVIMKDGIVITPDLYNSCYPAFDHEMPEDGVFTLEVHISKQEPMEFIVDPSRIAISVGDKMTLNTYMFDASIVGVDDRDIRFTITGAKAGFITVGNERRNTFNRREFLRGLVAYTCDTEDKVDDLEIIACHKTSNCSVIGSVGFDINAEFKQTGDNVFYAEVSTYFSRNLTASVNEVLWEIVDVTEKPQDVGLSRESIIQWSTHTKTSDSIPDNSPERGYGYDKLPEFRNLRMKYTFGKDLPKGVGLSSVGSLASMMRTPPSQAGSQSWLLPKNPGTFSVVVRATDPKTGRSSLRKYQIIVTYNGLSERGLASETSDLL